jgi:hypothetical protein
MTFYFLFLAQFTICLDYPCIPILTISPDNQEYTVCLSTTSVLILFQYVQYVESFMLVFSNIIPEVYISFNSTVGPKKSLTF